MEVVHIVHVDEVTSFLARSVDHGMISLQHSDDKRTHDRWNHSAPVLSRSVDVKIAHSSYIHGIKLSVTFTECSSAMFACGVYTYRSDVFLNRWKLIDALIFCGGICVHELSNFRFTSSFQNVQSSQHVHARRLERVAQTIGQAGFRREMEDRICSIKYRIYLRRADVKFVKFHAGIKVVKRSC